MSLKPLRGVTTRGSQNYRGIKLDKDFELFKKGATAPLVGEIKYGHEIGRAKASGWHKYIWHACENCGKERWVVTVWGVPKHPICLGCRLKLKREKSPHWKGGRRIDHFGYAWQRLYPNDFFYSMADPKGYVREHRLVMAKHLGRCLHLWEIVHHKNHKRDDNRIENLQLVTDDRHKQITILERKIKSLQKENRRLKTQLTQRELTNE